jgi:hypothetical protein
MSNKSVVFSARFAPEDVEQLQQVAGSFGVPVSTFVRQAALLVTEALQRGGTARCTHLAGGPVRHMDCGECGPMLIEYQLVLPSRT